MRNSAKNFFDNETGAVAVMAAIALPVSIALVAASVDYSSAFFHRTNAQRALDSATLQYMKTYVLQGNENTAHDAAKRHFSANISEDGWSVDLGPIREVGGSLEVNGTARKSVAPFMLRAIGMGDTDILVDSQTKLGLTSISAVLVPDVSHSMRGSHLNAAKRAMSAFGDVVFNLPRQFRERMHIAVTPYTGSVNVTGNTRSVDQLLAGWRYSSDGNRPYTNKHHYSDRDGCTSSVVHQFEEQLDFSGGRAQFRVQEWRWEQVDIVERESYWDEDEDGERVERFRDRTRREWQCVDKGVVRQQVWSGCLQTNRGEFNPSTTLAAGTIAPLPPTVHSSDGPHCPSARSAMRSGFNSASAFRSYIRGLDTGFSTAHDVGLLWGARMLEPAWSDILGVPTYPWHREEEYPKYLIFMSDGASVDIGYSFGDYVGRNRQEINGNVRYICDYLKDRGVTIFGVYYMRDSRPDGLDTVRNCASDDGFYSADITSVSDVFSEIGTRVVLENLRVSR